MHHHEKLSVFDILDFSLLPRQDLLQRRNTANTIHPVIIHVPERQSLEVHFYSSRKLFFPLAIVYI